MGLGGFSGGSKSKTKDRMNRIRRFLNDFSRNSAEHGLGSEARVEFRVVRCRGYAKPGAIVDSRNEIPKNLRFPGPRASSGRGETERLGGRGHGWLAGC